MRSSAAPAPDGNELRTLVLCTLYRVLLPITLPPHSRVVDAGLYSSREYPLYAFGGKCSGQDPVILPVSVLHNLADGTYWECVQGEWFQVFLTAATETERLLADRRRAAVLGDDIHRRATMRPHTAIKDGGSYMAREKEKG